jgi:Ca2+:H+ antiporter
METVIANLKGRLYLEGRRPSFRHDGDVEAEASETTPLISNGAGTSSAIHPDGHPTHHLWGSNDPSRIRSASKNTLHIIWKVLTSNYVNALLVVVPVGLVAGYTHMDPTLVFALNFVAIIPLAALLSFATEELSAEAGQTIGGLLNASFGNAIELIV